jgi:rod shape-determining protein MreC
MRNLILFIWKYNFFFTFLLLEILCFSLVVNNNYYHRASFINSSNSIAANILRTSKNVKDYFALKEQNEILARENAILRTHSLVSFSESINDTYVVNDTVFRQNFTYTSCKVVNNSVNRRNNYLTLNKGYMDGIKSDMAVITSNGVVGVVKDISANFCTVMSLLHSKTVISCKIKKNDFFGPLNWDGKDFRYALLNDIPTHASLKKGDTITTSSYSLLFPENIMIGTIESFERKPEDFFYTVKVKLSTDFKKLSYVYIVNNVQKTEQQMLEEKTEKDSEN